MFGAAHSNYSEQGFADSLVGVDGCRWMHLRRPKDFSGRTILPSHSRRESEIHLVDTEVVQDDKSLVTQKFEYYLSILHARRT